MNKNIENHNLKFHVGAILQGAEILEILKYSKNGKSTQFLYRCPICGDSFIDNARIRKIKICPKCDSNNSNKNIDKNIEENISICEDKEKGNQIICEELGNNRIGGVYSISTNGGIYIGESLDIGKRWKLHIQDLESESHHNFLLQNYYNKGRILKFEVIEGIKTFKLKRDDNYKTKLKLMNLIKESEYIKKFKELGDVKVFNIEDTISCFKYNEQFTKMVELFNLYDISEYSKLENFQNNDFVCWDDFKKMLKNRKNYKAY